VSATNECSAFGPFTGGFDLRSRFADPRAIAGFSAFLGLYAGVAFGFYWLMQPTVVGNRGMAAYQAPPKAVVSYVPWVPPAPEADTAVVVAQPAPAVEQSNVTPAKAEVKTHEARRTAPRERHARARPAPRYSYDVGRAFAFRPWF
jgi:hypothetical protein